MTRTGFNTFNSISEAQPKIPTGMVNTIMLRVEAAKKKQARTKVFVEGTLSILSMIAFYAAYRYAAAEFTRTGFSQYFSILFSDGDLVVTYWRQFILLLAESLPLIGTAALLTTVFIFVSSLRGAAKNARVAWRKTSIA